jgi:hypothetical protein
MDAMQDSYESFGCQAANLSSATGTTPVNVLVAKQGSVYYVAVFNYDITNPLSTTIDLGRAGLSSSTTYSVTDLWTGKTSTANGSLPVSLDAAESTILNLQ